MNLHCGELVAQRPKNCDTKMDESDAKVANEGENNSGTRWPWSQSTYLEYANDLLLVNFKRVF